MLFPKEGGVDDEAPALDGLIEQLEDPTTRLALDEVSRIIKNLFPKIKGTHLKDNTSGT